MNAYRFMFSTDAWESQNGVPQAFRVTADSEVQAACKASDRALDFFNDVTDVEHGVDDLHREGPIEVLD